MLSDAHICCMKAATIFVSTKQYGWLNCFDVCIDLVCFLKAST